MAADVVELMRTLGHDRFALVGLRDCQREVSSRRVTQPSRGQHKLMRIAPALLLTALGGILADAVTFSVPGIDRNALGAVLFFVGVLWLAVEVTVALVPMRRRRPPRPAPTRVRRPPRPYDPVLPPRGSPPPGDPDAPTADAGR